MADKTISDLTALAASAVAAADLAVLWDTSATVSKSLRADGLLNAALLVADSAAPITLAGGTAFTYQSPVASVVLPSAAPLVWSTDSGFVRVAANVVKPTAGATGSGWLQNTAGRAALSADVTNSTSTLANLTGLSLTLAAGRTYSFRMVLFLTNTVAAEGVQVDLAGGTTTATAVRFRGTLVDTALLFSTTATALATALSAATATGPSVMELTGTITVNAGGTFIPRAAENTHVTGTLTAARGSYIWAEDMP